MNLYKEKEKEKTTQKLRTHFCVVDEMVSITYREDVNYQNNHQKQRVIYE